MNRLNVAILAANSQIAKGLINNFIKYAEFNLHLYTTSISNAYKFLFSIGSRTSDHCSIHENYADFSKLPYDVIINCVGAGTATKLKGDYTLYFTLAEEYDNLVINYLLKNNPKALYISFSSGAVYGREHSEAVNEDSANSIKVNFITPADYYSIVRLNAEAKHRAYNNLKIVDLRIFSYFSRFANLQDGYFVTDVINSILNKNVLITDKANIVRDYLHQDDLFAMILKCIYAGNLNTAFDVASAAPVDKKTILEYFKQKYGLKYEIGKAEINCSATGPKKIYCSACLSVLDIGYSPQYTSMDTIAHEARPILAGFELAA